MQTFISFEGVSTTYILRIYIAQKKEKISLICADSHVPKAAINILVSLKNIAPLNSTKITVVGFDKLGVYPTGILMHYI